MITLITGENSFENERALGRIVASFGGMPERVDGSELALGRLPELVMGATLFSPQRLVIVKGASENKIVWEALETWLGRVSPDVHLVLVEPKPDKRTRTYRQLQKAAELIETKPYSERDSAILEQWVLEEATRLGLTLDKKSAHVLVRRVGVDQWRLYYALEKLAVLESVTPEVIERVVEAEPSESVFRLFETALKGDAQGVSAALGVLEATEDAYRLFGLLSGQVFHLAVLSVASKPHGEVAKDFGVHPFAMQSLAPYARMYSHRQVGRMLEAFADADVRMKTTATDPWLLIEEALIKTASV